MFGRPAQNGNSSTPNRPKASDVARIQGGGLVQVIVTSVMPMTFSVFLNDQAVPEMDVESLSIAIQTPETGEGVVRATLARYVTNVTGQKTLQHTELFPCTLELVALGRRLSMTATQPNSLDGLWIDLGLKPDGTANELSGLSALRVLLTHEILDAKITWTDGETEDVLPLTDSV
ncbi:MAG TPA: hypothetical protein VFB21_20650 [Chthonomonadaceae bacterium]|nr:hypothetical protein [Chthonomonadaceae bacterium]